MTVTLCEDWNHENEHCYQPIPNSNNIFYYFGSKAAPSATALGCNHCYKSVVSEKDGLHFPTKATKLGIQLGIQHRSRAKTSPDRCSVSGPVLWPHCWCTWSRRCSRLRRTHRVNSRHFEPDKRRDLGMSAAGIDVLLLDLIKCSPDTATQGWDGRKNWSGEEKDEKEAGRHDVWELDMVVEVDVKSTFWIIYRGNAENICVGVSSCGYCVRYWWSRSWDRRPSYTF